MIFVNKIWTEIIYGSNCLYLAILRHCNDKEKKNAETKTKNKNGNCLQGPSLQPTVVQVA